MAERLVSIMTFDRPEGAHLLKGRLEAEGIECHVIDPHPVSGAMYSAAVGGIDVRVWEADVERAREIVTTQHSE